MKLERNAFLAALVAASLCGQDARLEPPVRLEAGGDVIDTGKDVGYAGPLFVDHDKDGKPDLLVSAFRGNIRYFRNAGTRNEPEFVEGDPLHAGGEPIRIHNW